MTRRMAMPLTTEDEDIWQCVGLWPFFALNHVLEYNSTIQDNRDAQIMWTVEYHKHIVPSPLGYCRGRVHAIMRGAEQETGEVRFP